MMRSMPLALSLFRVCVRRTSATSMSMPAMARWTSVSGPPLNMRVSEYGLNSRSRSKAFASSPDSLANFASSSARMRPTSLGPRGSRSMPTATALRYRASSFTVGSFHVGLSSEETSRRARGLRSDVARPRPGPGELLSAPVPSPPVEEAAGPIGHQAQGFQARMELGQLHVHLTEAHERAFEIALVPRGRVAAIQGPGGGSQDRADLGQRGGSGLVVGTRGARDGRPLPDGEGLGPL